MPRRGATREDAVFEVQSRRSHSQPRTSRYSAGSATTLVRVPSKPGTLACPIIRQPIEERDARKHARLSIDEKDRTSWGEKDRRRKRRERPGTRDRGEAGSRGDGSPGDPRLPGENSSLRSSGAGCSAAAGDGIPRRLGGNPRPDRGIDIVAFTDPLGASGPRIKAQVKRRADKIPFQEVRSFIAVLGPTDVGIFVANGGFIPDGIKEARLQESRRVSLLAVDDLLDLWVEYYERIPEASRALLPLRPIYYLAPS